MTVIAPPRQSDSHDAESTVEPDRGGEALIEEAKQHARRRRRRVAVTAVSVIVAALAVTGAVTAALVAGGVGTPPSEPTSIEADAEVPVVGLADGEPVDVVASWAMYRRGWVMIFSDGRVLRGGDYKIHEQRLSSAGLDLVLAGRVTAHDVFVTFFDRQRDDSTFPDDSAVDRRGVWADQTPREYVPTRFAAYPSPTGFFPLQNEVLLDIGAGTQRNVPIMRFEQLDNPAWANGQECFVLSAEQVSAIEERGDVLGTPTFTNVYITVLPRLHIRPMMPDGSLVFWGG